MTTAWSYDRVTPICRLVEDTAILLSAIYGPDGKDNSIIDLPFNWKSRQNIAKLRIGYYKKSFKGKLKRDPGDPVSISPDKELKKLGSKVLDYFEDLWANLVPIDFNKIKSYSIPVIMLTENAAAFNEFTMNNMDDLIKNSEWPSNHHTSRFVPTVEYIQASRHRSKCMEKNHDAIEKVDLWIEVVDSSIYRQNITGLPTVIEPCGFTSNSMAAGVVFVGKLFDEARLLAVDKKFQEATDYHLKHPNL